MNNIVLGFQRDWSLERSCQQMLSVLHSQPAPWHSTSSLDMGILLHSPREQSRLEMLEIMSMGSAFGQWWKLPLLRLGTWGVFYTVFQIPEVTQWPTGVTCSIRLCCLASFHSLTHFLTPHPCFLWSPFKETPCLKSWFQGMLWGKYNLRQACNFSKVTQPATGLQSRTVNSSLLNPNHSGPHLLFLSQNLFSSSPLCFWKRVA